MQVPRRGMSRRLERLGVHPVPPQALVSALCKEVVIFFCYGTMAHGRPQIRLVTLARVTNERYRV